MNLKWELFKQSCCSYYGARLFGTTLYWHCNVCMPKSTKKLWGLAFFILGYVISLIGRLERKGALGSFRKL